MTAVLHDDVAPTSRSRRPTSAPAPKQASKRLAWPPIGGGDPMVDAAVRLLSIPLRQAYAALWRLGLLEVR